MIWPNLPPSVGSWSLSIAEASPIYALYYKNGIALILGIICGPKCDNSKVE